MSPNESNFNSLAGKIMDVRERKKTSIYWTGIFLEIQDAYPVLRTFKWTFAIFESGLCKSPVYLRSR